MMHKADLAPDFKPGYPSRGDIIGPAWSWLWGKLADRQWHRAVDLARLHWKIPNGPAPKTIDNLLRQAAKRGHLEKRSVAGRVEYRRKP